jgi:hypothetical protein
MKTKVLIFLVVSVMVLIFSCKKDHKVQDLKMKRMDVPKISYGTSFGMCIGYCINEMSIDNSKVIFTRSSWNSDQYPRKQCQMAITAEKFETLLNMTDSSSFNKLDTIYGCPDCADGGAEWVEITAATWKHKVKMDYSGPNRPEEMEALIDSLRSIQASFGACELK